MDAIVSEMWEDSICESLREFLEPIVERLLETGDFDDARSSLGEFFADHLWDDFGHARCRRRINRFVRRIYDAWLGLNEQERKELERITA
jgi:hypothetical protein